MSCYVRHVVNSLPLGLNPNSPSIIVLIINFVFWVCQDCVGDEYDAAVEPGRQVESCGSFEMQQRCQPYMLRRTEEEKKREEKRARSTTCDAMRCNAMRVRECACVRACCLVL